MCLVYGTAIAYFLVNRHELTFETRSPVTVAISMCLLLSDSTMNTLIFSGWYINDILHWQCYFAIAATVIGQYGFMLTIAVRQWRIYKVYNYYLEYLNHENQQVADTSPQHHHDRRHQHSIPSDGQHSSNTANNRPIERSRLPSDTSLGAETPLGVEAEDE